MCAHGGPSGGLCALLVGVTGEASGVCALYVRAYAYAFLAWAPHSTCENRYASAGTRMIMRRDALVEIRCLAPRLCSWRSLPVSARAC